MLVKVPVMCMWVPFMYQSLGGAYKLVCPGEGDGHRHKKMCISPCCERYDIPNWQAGLCPVNLVRHFRIH